MAKKFIVDLNEMERCPGNHRLAFHDPECQG